MCPLKPSFILVLGRGHTSAGAFPPQRSPVAVFGRDDSRHCCFPSHCNHSRYSLLPEDSGTQGKCNELWSLVFFISCCFLHSSNRWPLGHPGKSGVPTGAAVYEGKAGPGPESCLGQVILSECTLFSFICSVSDSNVLLPNHFTLLLNPLLVVIAFLVYG